MPVYSSDKKFMAPPQNLWVDKSWGISIKCFGGVIVAIVAKNGWRSVVSGLFGLPGRLNHARCLAFVF